MFKRGGVYWLKIRCDGRIVQKSLGTSNKKLAKAIEAKIRAEIVEGKYFEALEGESKTFKELADKYFEECSVSKAQSTRDRDEEIF